MTTIMPAFDRYPKEAVIIGKLLAGYGELEFDLCLCVYMACDDFDKVLKTMFTARGEKQRITEANKIGLPLYKAQKLGRPFSATLTDMHHCREIRNQFAHCHWLDDYSGKLGFVVLEEIAKSAKLADTSNLTTHYIDCAILAEQEAYFRYVSLSLAYLNGEGQKRAGTLRSHPWPIPKKMPRPRLHL